MKWFLLLLTISGGLSLFETNIVKPIRGIKAFERLIYESDQVAILYYHSDDCDNCKQMAPHIEQFATQNSDYFKVHHVQCNKIWEDEEMRKVLQICNPQYSEQLPQISYFQPTFKAKQPSQEVRFEGEGSMKGLIKFGLNLLKPLLFKIEGLADYEKFIQTESKLNKIILFTEKKTTSPLYKSITMNYFSRLHFAEVVENPESQALMDDFKIEDFPQLYVLKKNETGDYVREKYQGELKMGPIKEFLDKIALKERIELEHPELLFPLDIEKVVREEKKRERELKKTAEQEQKNEEERKKKEEKSRIVVDELNENNYKKVLLQTEKPVLVHVYEGESNHTQWITIQQKYKSLFDYYEVKVTAENEKFIKEQLGIKQYPNIRMFVMGNESRKKTNRILFPQDMDLEEIYKDVLDLVIDKSLAVDEQYIKSKLRDTLVEGRICIINFYNTPQVGLTYRVVSALSQFQEKFVFLSFKNAPESVLQQFSVTAQPRVAAIFRDLYTTYSPDDPLEQEQIRLTHYADKMELQQLTSFFQILLDQSKGNQEEQSIKTKKVIELTTTEEFKQHCDSSDVCYISLLNGQNRDNWESQVSVIQNLQNKHSKDTSSFVYVDAVCHSNLLIDLEVPEDEVPNFIAYNPKLRRYSKLVGRFDYEVLNRFMENYSKGKVSSIRLTEALGIKNQDCQQIYEERQARSQNHSSNDDDDDILKEILEEEKRKKQEMGLGKKNKKNKKKRDL